MVNPRVKSRTWIWHFDNPVDQIWPIMSDTARFNEAAELPKQKITEIPQPDGSVRYFAEAKLGLLTVKWEEIPVNWVSERWFEHCRIFENGPFREMCAWMSIMTEETGCRVEFTVEVEAANFLGRIALETVFFSSTEKKFGALVENARSFARGERETEFDHKPTEISKDVRERVQTIIAKINASPHGHGLADKLAAYVLGRQEVDVWSIRPLKLARLWNVPDRIAIELCLEAVVQGLLRLRWDLLCPRCQTGKDTSASLDELPDGAHCPSCNIDYGREYSKNVELAFHPANSIRILESGEYCLWGPQGTPHIKLQLTLEPGETRQEEIAFKPGNYRLRTLEPGPEAAIRWEDNGFPEFVCEPESIIAGPPSPPDHITLRNNTDRKLTFIIEEQEWMRDALTAHRATALQAFRDLFTEQVLRPGDSVEIDYITIMFTDLKGSTALYERIGDPNAYAVVREHFAILGKAVRENDGTIVKTIGDAIMAVFINPADAFKCASQIHDEFAGFKPDADSEEMMIKIGLHVGRCISVTLNDRLDYYGTAANLAARLQNQSRGGDIVLSREIAADPAVYPLLASYAMTEETANLKGFDEKVPFFRISATVLAEQRAMAPA